MLPYGNFLEKIPLNVQIASSLDMPTIDLAGLDSTQVWDIEQAFSHILAKGVVCSKRTLERSLQKLQFLPAELNEEIVFDELQRKPSLLILQCALDRARSKRKRVLFAQLHNLPNKMPCLHINDARGARYWLPFQGDIDTAVAMDLLTRLQNHIGRPIAIFPHGSLVKYLRSAHSTTDITVAQSAFLPVINLSERLPTSQLPPYLRNLEAESIHIIREAMAEAQHPVMLYSNGKLSAVLLHLIRKAFYPVRPPIRLLGISNDSQLSETELFRRCIAQTIELILLPHQASAEPITKQESVAGNQITKRSDSGQVRTKIIQQGLDNFDCDVIISAAWRGESHAAEPGFSLRTSKDLNTQNNQRAEFWNIFNLKNNSSKNFQVFPLSSWTEMDVWHYLNQENIPVSPVYFARERAVVVRDEKNILIDNDDFQLHPGEKITEKMVRVRSINAYPDEGAVESNAMSVNAIIAELCATVGSSGKRKTSKRISKKELNQERPVS